MKLDKTALLFFGCRIDNKLREALANAKPGDRKYFEDPTSEFLHIFTAPREAREGRDEKWIGKAVKGGLNGSEIEDMHRNVVSILRRICPDTRINPNTVKLYSIDPNAADEPEPAPESNDDGGAYIQY